MKKYLYHTKIRHTSFHLRSMVDGCHPCVGRNPDYLIPAYAGMTGKNCRDKPGKLWMPAFAGMTQGRTLLKKKYLHHTKTRRTSFHLRSVVDGCHSCVGRNPDYLIPAYAGMTRKTTLPIFER